MPSEVKSAAGVEKGQRGAAEGLIKYLILKGDALGIVLLEPFFRGVCVCEHLDVLGVANLLAGVDCPMREYLGDDPAAFVISLNLGRRHLNESQRAMVAAKLANMPNGGDRAEQHGANLHFASTAADLLNVSERSVKTAKQVQERAAPELRQAVEQGKVSVSAAGGSGPGTTVAVRVLDRSGPN